MATEKCFITERLENGVNGYSGLTFDTDDLLCRIHYYQHSNSSLTDCYPNVTKLHCNETPIALEDWPPKVDTDQMIGNNNQRIQLVMIYMYVPCNPKSESSLKGIFIFKQMIVKIGMELTFS